MQSVQKFPVVFTAGQMKTLEEWLEVCRWVWNEGRDLLLELDRATVYDKKSKTAVARSLFAMAGEVDEAGISAPAPVRVSRFKNKIYKVDPETIDGPEKEGRDYEIAWGDGCWIMAKDRKGGTVDRITGETTHGLGDVIRVGQTCPMPIAEWKEPRLGMVSFQDYTLQYWFTQKNMKATHDPEWVARFCAVPIWFIRGVCKSLSVAWKKYKSSGKGEPRYKRPDDKVRSLSHEDGKSFSVLYRVPTPDERAKYQLPTWQKLAGFIKIPKIGEVYASGIEQWGNRPIKVLRLVKQLDGWEIQLTGWEVQFGDCDPEEFTKVSGSLTEKELNVVRDRLKWAPYPHALAEATPGWSAAAEFFLRFQLPLWHWKRRAKTTLTTVGKDFVLAIDDQGRTYTALPKRPTDGAIDPHRKIVKIDAAIAEVEQKIAWKQKCQKELKKAIEEGRTNRIDIGSGKAIADLYDQLRQLRHHRAAIVKNNEQKIAHFISERSRSITVIEPPVEKVRKPKKKIKAGTFAPPEFIPNGADRIAEHNQSVASTATGQFIALIKQEATERGQKVLVLDKKGNAKQSRKKGKQKPKKEIS